MKLINTNLFTPVGGVVFPGTFDTEDSCTGPHCEIDGTDFAPVITQM